MADGDLALDVDGGEEGPLVVDAEVEDAMLVREAEGGGEDGGVGGGVSGEEGQPVEGGEHAEFELEGVGVGEDQRGVSAGVGVALGRRRGGVEGELDAEGLEGGLRRFDS